MEWVYHSNTADFSGGNAKDTIFSVRMQRAGKKTENIFYIQWMRISKRQREGA